jgi:nitrogen-specific signal transduction histidine kinase
VLTVITGMIDILADAVAGEPQLAAAAKLIDEAATRGATLSSRLLAFARGRASEPREVDVNALLIEASRLLRPALGGVEVAMVTAEDLPPAIADTGQLMAAVLSLAIAARNAMPSGGVLTLESGTGRMGEGVALPRSDDDAVVISLHACGYDELAEHPEQIFTSVALAQEFVAPCGGHVALLAPSGSSARAEIRLARMNGGAPWLADI